MGKYRKELNFEMTRILASLPFSLFLLSLPPPYFTFSVFLRSFIQTTLVVPNSAVAILCFVSV